MVVDVERYAIEEEIKRLDEIIVKPSSILFSASTTSTPTSATRNEFEK